MTPSRFAGAIVLALAAVAPQFSAQTATDQAMFTRDRVLEIRLALIPEDWRHVRLSHPGPDRVGAAGPDAGYQIRPADLWIDGVRVGRVGVRKKGTYGSVVSTRPSLKVKLDEYVRGQSYSGIDDLTLNNNLQDRSFVHQLLAYDFFGRAGIPAPRANLAHVTINDEDLGVYTHVEAIARPFLRRTFGNDNGALYEVETGDFTDAELSRIFEKRGSAEERRKLERLKDLLAVSGPVSLTAIGAIVDMDSFVRFWAAESLVGHWDGYSGNRNNAYIYIHPGTGKVHFIPWGADQVFIDPAGQAAALNPPKSFKAIGWLARRLWELPEIQTRYQAVMRDLLAGPWDEARILADMAAFQRNVPVSTEQRGFMEQADTNIRAFVNRRRAEVVAELREPAPKWPAPVVSVDSPYTMTGSFVAPWTSRAPDAPLTVGSATLTLTRDGKDVPVDLAGVYALTNGPPAGRADYPGLVITAVTGMRAWRIVMSFDPLLFGVGTLPIDQYEARAQLSIIEAGTPVRNRNLGQLGEIRFSEARTGDGGVLRGTFTLNGLAP